MAEIKPIWFVGDYIEVDKHIYKIIEKKKNRKTYRCEYDNTGSVWWTHKQLNRYQARKLSVMEILIYV